MQYHLLLSLTAAAMLGSTAFAGTMGPLLSSQDWGWVASIATDLVWARGGETQRFFLTPDIEKTYVAHKSSKALASGELFAGIQKSLSPHWLAQFGLAIASTGNTKLQGEIWDDADPVFDNHSYQYKIGNTRLALKGKLLLDDGYWAMPWVSASLGVGFNRAHDFTNNPLIFEALPNPNFSSNTKTAFTYTLGIGVQKTLNEHWQIGVGYEFSDWGKSELGRASGQSMHTGLTLNHLYTNGLLMNLTYQA